MITGRKNSALAAARPRNFWFSNMAMNRLNTHTREASSQKLDTPGPKVLGIKYTS